MDIIAIPEAIAYASLAELLTTRFPEKPGALPTRPWFKPTADDICEAIATAAGMDTEASS